MTVTYKHSQLYLDYQLGRKPIPKNIRDCAQVILYIVEHPTCKGYCDWLDWRKAAQDYKFMQNLREKLHEFLKEDANICFRDMKWKMEKHSREYEVLLDHHYWNDVDPFWKKGGYYDDTPGDDVILKIIAFYEKRTFL